METDLTKENLVNISNSNKEKYYNYTQMCIEDVNMILSLIKINAKFGKKTFDYIPIISTMWHFDNRESCEKALIKALSEEMPTIKFTHIVVDDEDEYISLIRITWDDPITEDSLSESDKEFDY